MYHRGVEFRILQTLPRGWRWQFEHNGVWRDGAGIDRLNAIHRAKTAIDTVLGKRRGPDRSDWQIGQQVVRDDGSETGTVIDANGSIKVLWENGQTSYFRHGRQGNVKKAE